MRTATLLVSCALAVVTASAAHGEDGPGGATSLREQGKAAIHERRLDDAVARFREGLAVAGIDRQERWQMLLGLALAHELRGEAALAVHYYRAFLDASEGTEEASRGRWADRRATALADADRLEPEVLTTHARVDLQTSTSGAEVKLAGLPPGRLVTPATLYLTPGQHQLELVRDGFAPLVLVLSVAESQRVRLDRALLPLEPPAPPAVPADPRPTAPPPQIVAPQPPPAPAPPVVVERVLPAPELEILGWSLAGGGVGAALAGVGWTVAAASTASDLDALARPLQGGDVARDDELRGTLRNQQAASAGFYAAGGALAVAGLLVLLLRPDDRAPIQPSSAGWGLEGRF